MIVVFESRYKKIYDVITSFTFIKRFLKKCDSVMILLLPPAILSGDQISDLLGTQSVKKGHRKDLPVVPITRCAPSPVIIGL